MKLTADATTICYFNGVWNEGGVHTPIPNGTFLNGITRQRVIVLLREAGIEVNPCASARDDQVPASMPPATERH